MIRRKTGFAPRGAWVVATALGGWLAFIAPAALRAYETLGIGTEALIGNDLTDLGDDGNPEADIGYDAIFDANHEPGFGSINADTASAGAGESAFNVFDNRLGPANDKWCCGRPGGIFEDDPLWVSARLPAPHFLSSFTISSANDTPGRDPIHFAVQGSNDGVNYTDIYVYQDDFAPWLDRLEVILWSEGEDFPVQTTSYEYFRFTTYDTANNQVGDPAYFQVGEIEFFGRADGVIPPLFVGGQGTIGQEMFEGEQSNEVLGPEQTGVPGWSGRIVTIADHGLTLDNHTLAEEALSEYEGTRANGAYPVVDFAGGAGTFSANQPYPNGVADESQDDFAVQVTANVRIPAGSWTIGFGSDDGGQLTIPGVVFDDFQNNDNFEDDQLRFEGNRGHGWTVGTFVLSEDLETSIIASFHERGGGDSFEIAILDEERVENASPGSGWELLADGTFGWSVTTTAAPLVSADLTYSVSSARDWQFDVNGDTNQADQFVVDNPDPNVFNTILNIDGVPIQINGIGSLANGDAFVIIDADQIVGTPVISSVVPGQNWVFDAATGRVCLVTCPGVVNGDFNGDGVLDASDIDDLTGQSAGGQNPAGYDLNGDALVNADDVRVWIRDAYNSWVGDANLDGVFNSSDLVAVLASGKYESGTPSVWSEGDFNGNGLTDSGDLVAALSDGGYEAGPRAALAAVPEPASALPMLLGLLGLLARRRR